MAQLNNPLEGQLQEGNENLDDENDGLLGLLFDVKELYQKHHRTIKRLVCILMIMFILMLFARMWVRKNEDLCACEEKKTKIKDDLDKCENDIDKLKSSSMNEIKTLEDKLQLAYRNIHLLESEKNKSTLNEQKMKDNLETCEQEKTALKENLYAKQLEAETCNGHLNTSKANLEDKTQQYETCLKDQTREKNQKDQCAISLTKCQLQANYVVRDHSTCKSKLSECTKDLEKCEKRHCFFF